MKRFISICLVICLAFSLSAVPAFGEEGIKVILDGTELSFDQAPINQNGRVLVPMRAIFEALGVKVGWDGSTRTVTGVKGEDKMSLTIGTAAITVNGVSTELDVAPVIENGRTLVPVRAISEALKANVEWEGSTNSVIISSQAADLDGNYYRLSTPDGKYIAVENASTNNGAKIVAANFANNDSQLWGFTSKGNNEYSIINKNSGKSLDIPASNTDAGIGVTQYDSNGGNNQTVVLEKLADGSYRLRFKHSGLYFTAAERYTSQEPLGGEATQSFTLTFAGETTMKKVKSSAGYLSLDAATRERFDTYVYETKAYTSSIYTQTSALIERENYLDKSAQEQQELLKRCLKFTAFNLVYIGEVMDEAKVTYEITNKEYIPKFDAWRGSIQPAWAYSVKMSDGYEFTMYSTVEDSSVVKDGITALSRFPLAMRQYLKRLIYRVDGANNYNGGGDTIWIRLNYVPSQNAIAQTLAHELGHILDGAISYVSSGWDAARAADVVPISGYGNNNRTEDLAEFSRLYHMGKRSESIMQALEKVYPNRMGVYRAMLYCADREYYSEFKKYYDKFCGFVDPEEAEKYSRVSLVGSNLSLGVENGATNTGAKLVVEEYTGKDSQKWWIRKMKDGNSVLFNKATGYCVNVPGNSNDDGKNLIVWNGGGGDNEKWLIEENEGTCTLKVKHSGLYLSTNSGTAIQSSKPASWSITEVE